MEVRLDFPGDCPGVGARVKGCRMRAASVAPTPMVRTWREDVAAIVGRDLDWERFAGRRVVVTGAGGFLGGYVARTLLALAELGKASAPVEVVAPVRSVERAVLRSPDLAAAPGLTFVVWDLNRIAVPDFGDIHYVVHAASQASPKFYGTDPVGTALPNAVGTAALLQALQASGDPQGFLYVSSGEVYGMTPAGGTVNEHDFGPLDPLLVRSCYAESKRMGENLCASWTHQYGLPTYVVRAFHTYGPGLTEDDGRVFADFAFNVVRGQDITMMSDGSARRAFCYASDATAGFFTALLAGAPGAGYNVGNPSGELSVLELAELLVGLYPERGLKVVRRVRPEADGYLPSKVAASVPGIEPINALGWSPTVTPAEGFRRMIDAYTSVEGAGNGR